MITYTPRCTLSDSTVRCPRLPPLARCPSALCFHHFKRKLLLLLWQLYYCTHTHTHTQREKSYYYFNNLQLFLVLRCQRRRGANVEGRVIQKQFVEIKFDYIYRPASTSTPSPTLSLTLCSASISRVAFIRSSLSGKVFRRPNPFGSLIAVIAINCLPTLALHPNSPRPCPPRPLCQAEGILLINMGRVKVGQRFKVPATVARFNWNGKQLFRINTKII